MSSLLNHIDNNRSEEDEDDHINRLFPKCKPRASSLSMSPSLQHMRHDSTSSTSASDLCLTGTSVLESQNRNSNYNRNNNNIINNNRNQCSSLRRHSAHNYSNDTILKQDSWNQSQSNREFTEIVPKKGQIPCEYIYDNNNPEYISDCLKPTISSQVPAVVKHSSESTHKNPSNRHKKVENHNSHQRSVARSSRLDRKQLEKIVSTVASHPYNNIHHHTTGNPSIPCKSLPPRKGQESERTFEHQSFPSVIPSQVKPNSVSRICESSRDKVHKSVNSSVTKALGRPSTTSESVIAMECNSTEDNFDNGIGSACSRSSGESSISNTSDFMENLISPVARGSAITGNGGNGFPPAVLTPSLGSLRDSRIEIAGGREVYSQNKIRASRRHRGSSSYVSSANDIMADPPPCSGNISSNKIRKKSLHSHSAYQHHCCHTNPCCGSTVNCSEVSLPGPLVWEPNQSCRRPAAVETSGSRQQYLSHSNSLGGTHQGVKCTHGCGFCGNHGFDYTKKFSPEFDTGTSLMGRNLPQIHGTSPTSPMAIIETVFSSEVRSVENSLPGNPQGKEKVNCEIRSPCQIEPVIYEAKVGDGKVVFDDIGEWRERQIDINNPVECGYDGGDEHDLSESQAIKRGQLQSPPSSSKDIATESVKNREISKSKISANSNNIDDLIEGSPCASNKDGNTTPSGYESDECSASASATANSIVTPSIPNLKTSPNFGNKRVIGSIPIAEYEGSPKRYGLKQQCHSVGTHFELVDVDIGIDITRESDQNLIGNEHRGQTLIEQTIAAATSSSSSSLDNTNTNVSSNSSSRTNHRISPRALSPSQPTSGYTTRFPGFPQRVNATSLENTGTVIRTPNQTSPNYENTDPKSRSNREEFNKSPVRMKQADGPVLPVNVSSLPLESLAGHINMNIGNIDFSTDDSVASQQGSVNTTLSTNSDQDFQCTRNARMIREEIGLVDTDGAHGSAAVSRSQDLLYEFSETRKVLEEFFNATGNPSAEHCRADMASFDELDYTLKRQAAGNSYVGQRLAGDIAGTCVSEDSPKKPPRRGVLLLGSDGDGSDEKGSPKLISFHEISLPQLHSLSPAPQPHQHRLSSHVQSNSFTASNRSPRSLKSHSRSQSQSPPPHDSHDPTRDINDNDIDVETASTNTETDLGDTEVGLQVGHSRNFTLSPETTDCDSNELESELSLDYEASLHSSSRIGVTMPVVEDGLSSGNESENEDIIEVDVGFHDDHCYLTATEIKAVHSPTLSRNIGNSPVVIPKKSIYQNNREKVTTFFGPECIPTGILDWTSPSIQVKTFIEGDFDGEDNDKPFGEGNSSEPNPTLMLMKKQISEIEKEIQLRASQQCQRLQNIPTDSLIETDIDMNIGSVGSTELQSPTSTHDRRSSESQDLSGNMFSGNCNGGSQIKGSSVNKNVIGYPEPGRSENSVFVNNDPELDALDPMRPTPPPSPAPGSIIRQQHPQQQQLGKMWKSNQDSSRACTSNFITTSHSAVANFDRIVETSMASSCMTASESSGSLAPTSPPSVTVAAAIQDIKEAIQRTRPLPQQRQVDRPLVNPSSASNSSTSTLSCVSQNSRIGIREQLQHSTSHERETPLICDSSPVWVPRQIGANRNIDHRSDNSSARDPLLKKQRYDDTPDDDADTDQETDRLLGQTRTDDDYGFYDEKDWKKTKSRILLPAINKGVAFVKSAASVPSQAPVLSTSASSLSNTGLPSANTNSNIGGGSLSNNSHSNTNNHSSALTPSTSTANSSQHLIHSKSLSPTSPFDESQVQLASAAGSKSKKEKDGVKKKRSKEDFLKNPSVLIEGVLFRARYLGSTQLTCEGQPTKATRMMQAEEAVSRIKAQANQNGTISHGTSEMQTQPQICNATGSTTTDAVSSVTPLSPTSTSNNMKPLSLSSSMCRETDFETSVSKLRKNIEESTAEMDDYFYPEEEESCCEDESLDEADGDEDLFEKSPHQSTGSTSSLRDKGMRLPLNDVHGSSNALQIHDNHTHPISLHHNRQSGPGSSCGEVSSGTSQPPIPHLSPPCGSALPGTMFRLRFVGSLEVDEEIGTGKRRRKRPKKTMVEEAVMKMKAPEGETQPSTEVDLFISTEKIMVLNTDLKEIMMDHALRTISYIADIGDLVVLMARRRPVPTDTVDESKPPRPPKMICHVFESDEAQYIAQSIGQAFQVAYMEFLKANGIEDSSFVREMDYQEVLNSQEIFGDELQMFAKKELQKEVVVPKTKGEILGVVIVESGWGSMLPTVVIANLAPAGAAARCGQLNIGDQIIAINGVSLVGLPLSTCQTYIKNTKTQTVVKLTVVPCPPVVEVKIKRPDTKYQLGFSVQNGVICSLLRGGIAERGGVRVGHRIIEINNQSVVAVPHEKIVNLLATSVGEINMKTMPTSMFRLLTGQETPLYI